MTRQFKQLEILPKTLGLNGEAVDSAVTGDAFGTLGYSQMTVEFEHTWAAGTNLDFTVEARRPGGTLWAPIPTAGVASGTITLADGKWVYASGGASGAGLFNLPINYAEMRIKVDGSSYSATSSDTVVVSVRLATP